MTEFMLTTFDNPYNPFTDFAMWFQYDIEYGYYSCAYLARLVQTDDTMTEEEEAEAMNEAIDNIIACDFRNIYRKVKETDEFPLKVQVMDVETPESQPANAS